MWFNFLNRMNDSTKVQTSTVIIVIFIIMELNIGHDKYKAP